MGDCGDVIWVYIHVYNNWRYNSHQYDNKLHEKHFISIFEIISCIIWVNIGKGDDNMICTKNAINSYF